MKKTFLATCAALLALSSCTNEMAEQGFVDKTNALTFGAYTVKSRAYTSGDVTIDEMKQEGSSFGVVGYSANNLYLGAETKAAVQTWNSVTNSWEYVTPSELRFWPANNMDFYAYFPYAADGASFTATNTTGDVMTIKAEGGDKDVIFAVATGQPQQQRVPLTFRHAFSKINSMKMEIEAGGVVDQLGVEIEVNSIEVIQTSTLGSVKVDNAGDATYETSGSDATRQFSLPSPIIFTRSSGEQTLFAGDANGYVFATNEAVVNSVNGTNKTLWLGTKASLGGNTITASGMVCLKVECKVKQSATGNYYVGSASDYGVMYIPMCSQAMVDGDSNANRLLAGKRYNYTIKMTDNVGFKENGDPILNPILFNVQEVVAWDDVNVTITL